MIDVDNLSNNDLDALATNADVLAQSSINYDEFLSAQLPPRETLLGTREGVHPSQGKSTEFPGLVQLNIKRKICLHPGCHGGD